MRSERHHRLPCVTGICFPNILLKPQEGPMKKVFWILKFCQEIKLLLFKLNITSEHCLKTYMSTDYFLTPTNGVCTIDHIDIVRFPFMSYLDFLFNLKLVNLN